MKIAIFSFEYPPETNFGGIATASHQLAKMLASRSHYVEVFSGSFENTSTNFEMKNILVHRIKVRDPIDFIQNAAKVFFERHTQVKFDILETGEFGADAAAAIRMVPDIPLVVKLHTPKCVLKDYENNATKPSLRSTLGLIRRGINPLNDIEEMLTLEGDIVIAPSHIIGSEMEQRWNIEPSKIRFIPLVYTPSFSMLKIPIHTISNSLTFVGRLEIRKGITDIAEAIPKILNDCPNIKINLIGKSSDISPTPGMTMITYLKEKLEPYLNNINFVGQIDSDKLPEYLGKSDVVVLPSRFDSFGLVCLEAMSAGRGVVGSSASGMAEMLNTPDLGRLVPANSPDKIAESVIELMSNPKLRMKLGENARKSVISNFNSEVIGKLHETTYIKAIEIRRKKGSRKSKMWL